MVTEGPAGRLGKWSQSGVPKVGWICVDIEDLGTPSSTCEMCETQSIRYVHHMEHPAFQETLKCGCVCAGYMEDDLQAAEGRDKAMKSRSGKRSRWLGLATWRRSQNGNATIVREGYRTTVFFRDGQWIASVKATSSEKTYYVKRRMSSENEAKLAAFDKITQLNRIENIR